ncbi:MAG: isoprenylcysteine carboxylmethyltransferase family protein [Nitrospirae bacterium]|nr:isoprenylcysteine carboxylmethyltransferase family protein [Nitrospirota bacterium]
MNKTRTMFNSAIVLYFVIGLEILIMISPFAGFFYSVFNPFLLEIAKYPSTKWLSSFFLPHMVVPPDDFLKFVRVMGSVFFAMGMAVFIGCALQVYANKLMKRGTALKGLYSVIRHPQYAGLGIAGIGLSILWPRFLLVVLWLAMIIIYYFLSKDEEHRMMKDYPETYAVYMGTTGMFLPIKIERLFTMSSVIGKTAFFLVISMLTISGAFCMRSYTIKHLPLWTSSNIAALAILPEDMQKMEHRMPDIVNLEEVKTRLNNKDHYLVYFLPANYIMQGLIADTGSNWKLYKQHHSMSMITDWIFHPFSHLREGHHAMSGTTGHSAHDMNTGIVRRLLFLKVSNVAIGTPSDLFSINALRTPQFMIDMEIHNLKIIDLKDLPEDTGWGKVPTPAF